MLKRWNELPEWMRNEDVRRYYDTLQKKKFSLVVKRVFDVVMAGILLIILAIPMGIVAIAIKRDSEGSVFYRQERVTCYGKKFRIHKFRTMVENAEKKGSQITKEKDSRITRVGGILRKLRIDEIPQLIDILEGNMSFVGVRPEVPQFVEAYSNEMFATLLLPAGVTGEACIQFNGVEQRLMEASTNIEKDYVELVLPQKMKYNLDQIEAFSLRQELMILIRTVIAVI